MLSSHIASPEASAVVLQRKTNIINSLSGFVVNNNSHFQQIVSAIDQAVDDDRYIGLVKLLLGPIPQEPPLFSHSLKNLENELYLTQIAFYLAALVYQGKLEEINFKDKNKYIDTKHSKSIKNANRIKQAIRLLKRRQELNLIPADVLASYRNNKDDNSEQIKKYAPQLRKADQLREAIAKKTEQLNRIEKELGQYSDILVQVEICLKKAREEMLAEIKVSPEAYLDLELGKDFRPVLVQAKKYNELLKRAIQSRNSTSSQEDLLAEIEHFQARFQGLIRYRESSQSHVIKPILLAPEELSAFTKAIEEHLQNTIDKLLPLTYDWLKRSYLQFAPLYDEEQAEILTNHFAFHHHKEVEDHFRDRFVQYKNSLLSLLTGKNALDITFIVNNLSLKIMELQSQIIEKNKAFEDAKKAAEATFRKEAHQWLTHNRNEQAIKMGVALAIEGYIDGVILAGLHEIRQEWLGDPTNGNTLLHIVMSYYNDLDLNPNKMHRINQIAGILFRHGANAFVPNRQKQLACDFEEIAKRIRAIAKNASAFELTSIGMQQAYWELLYSQIRNLNVHNPVAALFLKALKEYVEQNIRSLVLIWKDQAITDKYFTVAVQFAKLISDARFRINDIELLQFVAYNILALTRKFDDTRSSLRQSMKQPLDYTLQNEGKTLLVISGSAGGEMRVAMDLTYEALRKEQEVLRKQLIEKETESLRKDSIITQLETNFTNATEENKQLTEKNKQVTEKNKEVTEKNNQLIEELARANVAVARAREQIAALEKRLQPRPLPSTGRNRNEFFSTYAPGNYVEEAQIAIEEAPTADDNPEKILDAFYTISMS